METQKYVLKRDLLARRQPSYRIDYGGELNAAQYDAVTTTEGPLLVVAGAGTGKTRTLVFRVARLVENGVDPANILLLTFSRRAAAEMLQRATALVDGRCERIAGGTFHSFANSTLRRMGAPVGLESSFTILDRGDAEDVINLLRAEMGLDSRERRFPRKQTILEIFSMAVNKSTTVDLLLGDKYGHLLDHRDDLLRLHEAFGRYKAARQLVDYDDLLVKLWTLLDRDEGARRRLGQQFRYIMVDEYQDTNVLQAGIVGHLAREHGNVMAVGDDAQSIYSFRGAHFRNIMDFPSLFPETRVIALEHNYRSTQPILDVSNAIISRAPERHRKDLFSHETSGPTPLLIPAENERFQSRFVSQRILELREEGIALEEIAVLFRSSFHSFGLEIELNHHDIPFVKRGGFKFVETAHIKDVLAHVKVLLNPFDSIAWHRVLTLIEGIGPRTAEEIIRWMLAGPDAASQLLAFPERSFSPDLEILAHLIRGAQPLVVNPEMLITQVLRYYDPLLKRIHPEDHPKRRRDLDHFATIAARYHDAQTLVSDMALEPPTDRIDETLAVDRDPERLTLSTVHSAKGLEWHTVFIIWAAEGRFPSNYVSTPEELEEERRLMYVATTRAKRNLYISYPVYAFERDLGTVLTQPSQFIEGIAPQILAPVHLIDEPLPEF